MGLFTSTRMPTTCGTLKVGAWPDNAIGEDTAVHVKFGIAFDDIPSVVVQLAAIDAAANKGRRIDIWASDETHEGFRLHVRTWEDSVVWSVKVSWVATSEPTVVQLGLLPLGGWPDSRLKGWEEATGSRADFSKPFACTPDVALGISALDAQGDQLLRVRSAICDTSSRGLTVKCGTWGPSVLWHAKLSWIACASPAVLQCGTLQLGSATKDFIREGRNAFQDVKFQREFDEPPSVAVAVCGIDADHSTHTRIDTWADDVRTDGFRLYAQSWGDSLTYHVVISWVATPVVPSVTVSSVPPHHPPKEYAVDGPPLGQGWWGVTHRAKHLIDGKVCAVKTCKHSFKQNEKLLGQELQNLSCLPSHHNLLQYYASILRADRLHIVTEYIDAFNLADLVPGPLGPYPQMHLHSSILRWMAQLCDGLAHLHRIGMVHRDLHGGNILVEKDSTGRPSVCPRALRIIDFGLAKVYDVMQPRYMSQQAGTWQYFSPERRKGEQFDCRDDVWAAGCHLTELVTGVPIQKRQGCGVDGIDFALSPQHAKKAVKECGGGRCGQIAAAVLVVDLTSRPSAAGVRDVIYGMMPCMPGKRAGPSGGGRAYGPMSPSHFRDRGALHDLAVP